MSDSKSNHRAALLCLALALITFIVFSLLLKCDFINFDDNLYVTENPQVQSGLTLATVRWAFQATVASNWHPLTWLSHALDCQLYGLKPTGHHLTNLLLHIANTLLLFIWLRRLTGADWRSALVAALFAWHPLHVESVAWVAERKDVLSACFGLLTLLSFLKFQNQGPKSKLYYWLALLCFALGLLCKPMLVTLPFVLLLIDFWQIHGIADVRKGTPPKPPAWKQLVSEKISFFVLSIASCVVTFLAQKKGGAVDKLENLPASARLANALVSYVRYLAKTIWPADLAVIYPHPRSWPLWQAAASAAVLLAISIVVVKLRKRRAYLAFGWFWFLGTLVPVIGLVQVGRQAMADRYTYLPLIGIFIMLAWLANDLAERAKRTKRAANLVVASVLVLLIACATATAQQTLYWANSETLFRHAIRVTANNFVAYTNLGDFLWEQGRASEALADFQEAVRIQPAAVESQIDLGDILAATGQLDQAIDHLQKAVQLAPNNPTTHFELAKALAQQGKLPDANFQYREALRFNPGWPPAAKALAIALAQQGDLEEAVQAAAQISPSAPGDPELETQLAGIMARLNRVGEAISHYQQAIRLYREQLRLKPDSSETLNNLAWLLAANPNPQIRNGREAVALAQKACDLTGRQHALVVGTLAAAYAEAGQFSEAVKAAQSAREIALAAGDNVTAARNADLLKLYQSGQPYHQPY